MMEAANNFHTRSRIHRTLYLQATRHHLHLLEQTTRLEGNFKMKDLTSMTARVEPTRYNSHRNFIIDLLNSNCCNYQLIYTVYKGLSALHRVHFKKAWSPEPNHSMHTCKISRGNLIKLADTLHTRCLEYASTRNWITNIVFHNNQISILHCI